MKPILPGLLFVSLITVVSFAGQANVTTVSSQTKYGTLTNICFETIPGPAGTTPSTNTALIPTGNSGSYNVTRGSSAYLWSPIFSSATTISAGTWVLDMWVQGAASGAMRVSAYITDSSGNILITIADSVSTTTISTSPSQVETRFSGTATNIPANSYICVAITAPTGAGNPESFTIYWGSGNPTNFQVPYRVLT